MHFNERKIKSFLDGELPPVEQYQVKEHLDICPACHAKSQELLRCSLHVHNNLRKLDPKLSESAPNISYARSQLASLISRKESDPMFNKLFTRKFQPLWIGAALVLLLAVVLSVPSVRVLANNFLGLFRVEQFTVVQVDPARIEGALGNSARFEELLSRNVEVVEDGEAQEVGSSDEAAGLAGFPVRMPASFTGDVQLMVTPKTDISFQVDLKLIQGILGELDLQDVDLPDSINGETVSIAVARGVTAASGECEINPEMKTREAYDPGDVPSMPLTRCTTFVQMPSPGVHAPPGLDIVKIGEAYLQLLGMSPEEAAEISSNIDWTTTLVIPIPTYGTRYEQVPVDGVTGTLVLSEGENPQYLLMWVKDGMIYGLTGPGDSTTALRTAATIE